MHVSLEHNDLEPVTEFKVVGIDRGIVNIAVCSDNTFYDSKKVKNTRAEYAHLRKELQSKGTKSAKRKLKRLAGKERRFVTDVNHCISKQIVNSDYTVFALEDLSKIRVQKRRGKQFNHKLNNWSFYQLEQFIRYKAEALGKHTLLVDARYTSQ
jgi:IS605 OrfB family transposase